MIKIAVCENDNGMLETLSRVIKEVFACFNTCVEVRTYSTFTACGFDIEDDGFELIILNTRLDNRSGLDFAKSLRRAKVKSYLIFISDTARYALDSYDVGAFFYFVKPPDETKFEFVMKKIAAKLCMPVEKTVILRRASKVVSIPLTNILWVSSEAHNIVIKTKDGGNATFGMKLDDFIALLDGAPEFIRIHKSYLLNAKYIKSIDAHEAVINGESFAVSRAMKNDALKAYNEYLKA